VATRLPSSRPAAASTKAPVQTEPKRRAAGAAWRSQRRTSSRAITARSPAEPPATRKVSGWPPGLLLIWRLCSTTPQFDRTAPPLGETIATS
jgi:hypothetical protein